MRSKLSNVLWGIVFIAAGLLIAGKVLWDWDFKIFFDGWWTLFIIVPCLISIFHQGPRISSFIGIIIGVLLLLSAQGIIESGLLWKLILPIILIAIGLKFIFRNTFNKGFINAKKLHTDGALDYTAVFSSQNVVYPNMEFKGAESTAVFGGVSLNIRDAIINEDIVINATAVFGGIDIFVPDNVKVVVSSVPIFGGTSNKKNNNVSESAPTIFLNSTCIFGGVDVK